MTKKSSKLLPQKQWFINQQKVGDEFSFSWPIDAALVTMFIGSLNPHIDFHVSPVVTDDRKGFTQHSVIGKH